MASFTPIISPFSNAILQSTNSAFGLLTKSNLQGHILTYLNEIMEHFLINQLRDHVVTMMFEDYFIDDLILFRICVTNNKATFCWKWMRIESTQCDAKFIATIIQNEISTLSEHHIFVTGFASSNSEIMRVVTEKELLKKQIIVQSIPYTSFMIEDICREFFAIPKIQEIWSLVLSRHIFKA